MHTFVVVSVMPGRRLPDHVRRILRSGAPTDLTFRPDEHLHWASGGDDLHFAGWQSSNHPLGIGSYWEARRDDITAFAGHLWLDAGPWRQGRSWAAQLADELSAAGTIGPPDARASATSTFGDSVARFGERLEGVYHLLHLTAGGRGFLTNDPLGAGLLYQGRSRDVAVFSNRASLVARLIAPEGTTPPRDAEAVVSLVYSSNLSGDRTAFAGVTTTPQASVVELEAGREPHVHVWATKPWIDSALTRDRSTLRHVRTAEVVAPVVERMRRLIRAMAALPAGTRTVELTGGRDSRMVLALVMAEELADSFTFITWGSPDLADVVIAGQLADRFDLDLRAEGRPRQTIPSSRSDGQRTQAVPGSERLPYEALLRHHVWRTSGSVSVWDLSTHRATPSDAFALSGLFGETLRSNYTRTDGIRSMADLATFVRVGGFNTDAARLLRPAVRRRHDDIVLSTLNHLLPVGGTPQDAVDGYNLTQRLRRWFGSSHELDDRNRMFPLYSLSAIQVAFALGSTLRRREVLPFEVIMATCPELATIAFASSGWPESLVAGRPDRDRYPTAPDAPPWSPPFLAGRWSTWPGPRPRLSTPWRSTPTATGPRGTVEQRRMSDIEAKIPVLLELVDLGPTHELYRYLDYRATIRAVRNLGRTDHFSARRCVHDAVTAAIWLGGAELREAL